MNMASCAAATGPRPCPPPLPNSTEAQWFAQRSQRYPGAGTGSTSRCVRLESLLAIIVLLVLEGHIPFGVDRTRLPNTNRLRRGTDHLFRGGFPTPA